MKKKIIIGIIAIGVVLTIIGFAISKSESKKERTLDYLLDRYIKIFTKADIKSAKEIFPDFYIKSNKENINQKSLNKRVDTATKAFGKDYKISYKINKETRLTDKELMTLNKNNKKMYKTNKTATECYKYEGVLIIKGSKKIENISLKFLHRCKYDGTWYLM